MLPALLALVLVAASDLPPPSSSQTRIPRLSGGLEPLKPLAPLTPRTLQPERGSPSNPFLGRRTADFQTVRGPSSLPPTAGLGTRVPGFAGHANELVEKLYMNPKLAREVRAAVDDKSRRLPAGALERRHVWVRDPYAGRRPGESTVILTNPGEKSLMPADYRRYDLTPTVTVGRIPMPSLVEPDRFLAGRTARDLEAMRALAARQAQLNQERLGYDRVRSLWTPPGTEAASSIGNPVPLSVPDPLRPPSRGVQVYDAPIGPMPLIAAPATQGPNGWHPPMTLPDSTLLP